MMIGKLEGGGRVAVLELCMDDSLYPLSTLKNYRNIMGQFFHSVHLLHHYMTQFDFSSLLCSVCIK